MDKNILGGDMLYVMTYDETNMAFIKSESHEGQRIWEIYGADGTKLASTDNRECAFLVAKQNDLNPQSVH